MKATNTDCPPLYTKYSHIRLFLIFKTTQKRKRKGVIKMPTPPKPYTVLKSEGKSHRTKKELELREKGEKSLTSGVALKERPKTKNNVMAHKEFLRINRLLSGIEKNDALYEPIINRYCMLQAECEELEAEKDYFFQLIKELKQDCNTIMEDIIDAEMRADYLLDFTKSITTLTTKMLSIDKTIQSKRKMLLDIEKECVMTVASALRSIPKKVEEEENPLLKALADD